MLDPEMNAFSHVMIGKTEKGLIKDTIFLEPECSIDVDTKVVVFVLKPNPVLIKTIIRLVTETKEEKKFLVFLCPRYTVLCKDMFEAGNVLKSLDIHELPYELIPLEKDLLSLDDNSSFRNLILGYNYQSLTLVKHSVQRLEALYGKIPIKCGKGPWSCTILNSLAGRDKDKDPHAAKEDQSVSEIDALIMLDRSVDMYTPLLTQMTFEGIIDEFFDIKCGIIDVDTQIVDPETKGPAGKRTLHLFSSEDIMFAECRDLHFNLMKEQFPNKYEEMKKLCEKKDSVKTVAEMTEYMRRLKNLKIPQLKVFFNISTIPQISPYRLQPAGIPRQSGGQG
ncbi:MAG: hypothetical protein P4L67_00965 [Candidatus Pacebacteria bacterium]|nr:hypothetical protein [Candidatus Paceibacterota bacterium]